MTTGNVVAGYPILAADVLDELAAAARGLASTATTLTNSTTETALATYPIGAADAAVGAVYRISGWGTAVCTGTPTMTFRARLGGAAGTSMIALGAVTLRSGMADGYWEAEFLVSCVSTGASGTWAPKLTTQHNFLTSATTYTALGPITAAPVTRDTTIANDMVFTGQWSASSSSNIIICRGFDARRVA